MQSTLARPAVQPVSRLPFGYGLSAKPQRDNTAPKVRPYSDADAAWAAQHLADDSADDLAAMLDEMAEEREVARLMEAGLGTW